MPPRRHPAKKNSRMDAAVENMAHMGFEKSLVKSTVQELLKLYTEDGWCLIEEHSYSVLLNALLEKTVSPPQQEEQEPVLLHLQLQEGEGDREIVIAESTVGSSNMTAAENQENTNTKAAEEETEGETEAPSPPPPQRQRKPCNGWRRIRNSKDEAAGEIIELPTMPLDVIEERWSFFPLR